MGAVLHRVKSDKPLYVNWYYFDEIGEVKVFDEKYIGIAKESLYVYKVDGKLYKSIKSVMSEYSIKQSTAYYRLTSKNYANWEKL